MNVARRFSAGKKGSLVVHLPRDRTRSAATGEGAPPRLAHPNFRRAKQHPQPLPASRFAFTHPSFTTCRERAIASESAGTSSVMHAAAPT